MASAPLDTLSNVIAFVDDEVDFACAIVDLLVGEFGAENVAGFTDPLEADQWLAQHKPAVLIADLRMPGMNGIELVSRARQRWPGLPVVLTTSYPSEIVEQHVDDRTFFYLPKPFSFHDLGQLIRGIRVKRPAVSGTDSEIVEVLSLYAMAGYTGSLVAHTPGHSPARVWLRAGDVIHARCGNLTSYAALAALIASPGAQFDWVHDNAPDRTIDRPLAEALRQAFSILHSGSFVAPTVSEFDDDDLADVEIDLGVDRTLDRYPTHSADAIAVDEDDILDSPPEVEFDLIAPTGSHPVPHPTELNMANNIAEILNELQSIEGFIAAAVADSASGMALGKIGGGASFNVEMAAAANTEVVKAKLRAMKSLKLDDVIEDILITLGTQYHLIRPLRKRPEIFFYAAVDRRRANLAVARFTLADAEEKVVL